MTMKKFNFSYLQAQFAALILPILLATPMQLAQAYQVPTSGANTWTVVGGFAQKSTPSGVRVNVSTTGIVGFATLNNTALMAGTTATGTPVGTFLTPALPAATNGLQLTTSTAASNSLATTCNTSSPTSLVCSTFGTVVVNFTDAAGQPIAVRNPVMHLSRVAGFNSSGANAVYFGVTHTLTTAGVAMGAIAPSSQGLAVSGNTVSPIPTPAFNGVCVASGPAQAGCGSVPLIGTASSLSFNIGALRQSNAANAPWNTSQTGADAWYITFTFDEDFGDAPVSFQSDTSVTTTAPASHILSELALGSAFTTNNNYPATLNGTIAGAGPFLASPVQVAAAANNNGAAGDGAEENGLTTFAPLTTDLIGSTYTLTPTISGASRSGQVCGWIDFNRDGVFTPAEGKCSSFGAGATAVPVVWTVPTATVAGNAYLRLRVSYDTTMTTASMNGLLNSGEVEDYNLEIKPVVRVVKTVTPSSDTGTFNLSIAGTTFATAVGNTGTTGFKSVYHIDTPNVTVATNVSTVPITGVVLTETGAGATTLANYTTTSLCTNAAGTPVDVGGSAIAPSITIPQSVTGASANGQAQTITCTLTNTRNPTLTVNKMTNGAGSTGIGGAFTFATNNGGTFTAVTTTAQNTPVASATNTTLNALNVATVITETLPAGGNWVMTSANCIDTNAAISGNPANTNLATFNAGASATTATVTIPAINIRSSARLVCDITNTRRTLEVKKVLIPANEAATFNLLQDGVVRASAIANSGTTTPLAVTSGVHTFAEDAVAPNSLANYDIFWKCVNGDGVVNSEITVPVMPVNPAANGVVALGSPNLPALGTPAQLATTCTITNIRRARLTFIKQAVPVDATPFAFSSTFVPVNPGGTSNPTMAAGFNLTGTAPGNQIDIDILNPAGPGNENGTYTVTETLTAAQIAVGWNPAATTFSCLRINAANISSTQTSSTNTIVLPVLASEKIVCTVTNRKVNSDMVPSLASMPTNAQVGVPYVGNFSCTNTAPAATGPASVGTTCAIAGLPAGLTATCNPPVPTALPVAVGAVINCTVTGTPTAPGNSPLTLTTGAANDINGGTTAGGNNTATSTIVTTGSDMVPSLAGMPTNAQVGVPYAGSFTCTNTAPAATAAASAGATCAITGLPAGLTVVCTPSVPTVGTVAIGAAITCSVTGTPTAIGTAPLTVTTGAANDVNGGVTSGGNNSVGSAIATTGSDMVPSLAGMPPNAQLGVPYAGTYTCTNTAPAATAPASTNTTCAITGLPAGLTTVCIPAVPTVGTVAIGAVITCTVTGTPTAIGSAPLTLVTGAANDINGGATSGGNNSVTGAIATTASDMVPSLAGMPTTATVGAPYTGSYTCTNTAPAATAAASVGTTCAIAGLPPGLTAVCTPAVPTVSTVAIGAVITCNVSGTPTAIGTAPLTLTTGAANDINGGNTPDGNNSATSSITTLKPTIDVVKAAGVPKQIGPKVFEVSYSVVVANVCAAAPGGCAGTATAFNVQVNDNLTPTFPTATSITVSNYAVASGANGATCTPAATAYQGNGSATALFSGVNDLAPGQSCVATFKVTVDFGAGAIPTTLQNNLAYASAVAADTVVNAGYTYTATGAPIAPSNAVATDISTTAAPTSGAPGTLPATPLPPTVAGSDSASGVPTGVVFALLDDGDLSIRKSTATKVASSGDVVEYSVLVSNSSSSAVRTRVSDTPPAGFEYVNGTTKVNGSSSDAPIRSGNELIFDIGNIPAKSSVELRYQMKLGDDVVGGEATNCVGAFGVNTLSGTNEESGKSCVSVIVQTGLFLEKRVNVKNAELGDSIEYSLRVKSVGGRTNNVTIPDSLPLGFKLIEGTVRVIRASGLSVMANPAGSPGPALNFNVGSVANKEIVEIRYRVRLGIGADLGDGINRAQAKAPFATSSLVAQAKVLVTRGVFTREACIAGKVYVDCNQNDGADKGERNAMQDKGELGIPGVRLYMEDGTNMTTDENGQYSICGIRAISHVMKVDTTTMPAGSIMGITSNRNLNDGTSLMLNIKAGDLYRADFNELSCTPSILKEVETRRSKGVSSSGARTDVQSIRPVPQVFDSKIQELSLPPICETNPTASVCSSAGSVK
jgi:uncharacterized repeat protein (TIGR01451 family)